ncbi:esterase/lipase family protein [Streptomyces sp. NPDC012403]|uniref:esterase/lipase family protein n=1 Tax=unclassified Streptomyces TaxID=2593676 RepID=UPI0020B8C0F8|nr:alpha/beta hydrolase [Streptomyces sp. AC558_RSS880]
MFISTLLAVAITLAVAAPASAADAPSRSNSKNNVVFFVHGFDPSGAADTDCSSYWSSARTHFKNKDWTGGLVTFGYYSEGKNCTYKYNGTRGTSITTVAKALANRIYNNYSRHGRKVDVVAHSMGGLVIRSALYNVRNGASGFPPYLYIEDVVTLGTPHNGANGLQLLGCKAAFRGQKQCSQMTPGSVFLERLPEKPSISRMGTDWTVVSSYDDATVSENSGVGVDAKHKLQYNANGARSIDHTELKSLRSGTYLGRTKTGSGTWSGWADRGAPLERARQAVYWHSSR